MTHRWTLLLRSRRRWLAGIAALILGFAALAPTVSAAAASSGWTGADICRTAASGGSGGEPAEPAPPLGNLLAHCGYCLLFSAALASPSLPAVARPLPVLLREVAEPSSSLELPAAGWTPASPRGPPQAC